MVNVIQAIRRRMDQMRSAVVQKWQPNSRLEQWWPLLPILLFSIVIRIGYLPVTHGMFEWIHMGPWADGLLKTGLFQYYFPDVAYPIYSPLLTLIAFIQSWRRFPFTPTY